jgi:ELWxxDGT repeat protein
VCNGVPGQDGVDGSDGADGADGANGSSTLTMMVARLSAAPTSMGCNGTGELLEQGMDDGRNGGIAQNGILESSEVLFRTLICTQFDVEMVEDFNPGATGSNPSNFVSINSTMYFTANNGTASGIWAYENGTISLAYSGSVLNLRAIGTQLMFSGQGQGLNVKPYVYEPSNGTAWQITEIFPGGSSYPGEFTLIGTTVFFGARDSSGSTGTGVFDLWAYETLNYSVWKVEADIQPSSLIAVNSDLYFSAGLNAGNVELWKHETSTNTTFMVKDINSGILSSSPENLVLMGTTIYMSANDGSVGSELHAYDVTNNSTWLAADIRPGVAGSMLSDLTVMGTRLYMQATSGTHFELWAYESTNHSFWQVTNFQSTSGFGGPSGFTSFDGKLYFKADDGSGAELWATSPTNHTVWLAKDIHPTGASTPSNFYAFGGELFFAADDGTNGREIWSLGVFEQVVSFV